jgi:hypothetical protein
MRTAWHALAMAGLSGQRRFVPRASTAVNYKFAPLGARKWRNGEGSCAALLQQKLRRMTED